MDKLKVIVLGCTGLVGQRFLTLLKNHPMFEVVGLVASERNVGKKYREAVRWVLEEPLPEEFAEMEILPPDPDKIPKVDLIFSALPSDVAGKLEIELVKRGQIVVSNASNNRLDPDVPLIVPEINADHLELLKIQRKSRGWPGLLVKNANCTTIILTLSLKPVHDAFTIRRIFVTTMQAVSGAGIGADAVQAVSIIDNIIPYIKKEEEKVHTETRKILGKLENNNITWANFNIYATTTRVPVIDGHLESVYIETEKEIDIEELYREIEKFNANNKISKLNLPTSPPKPIIVRKEPDRPQPRLDRMEGKGMSIVIGRVRKLENNILTYLVLGHNTIRGAAGNTILIAETLAKQMPEIIS